MNEISWDPMLAEWLHEGPERGSRDGLERALAAIQSTRQRPGWMYFERWIPTPLAIGRVGEPRLAGAVALIVLLALILALAAAIVGSRPRLPAPSGPAANGLMAFEADQGVYVARADGSERRKVSGDGQFARSPEFSPDGTLLAYVSSSSSADLGGPLFVVPTDGSAPPINVSGDIVVARAHYSAIAWSPDGRRIAFGGYVEGVTSIVVAASDGTGAATITDRAAIHDLPSWSPDGRLIAYRVTQLDRSSVGLAIALPDGSNERILTNVTGPDVSLSIARWSPDGSRLAYYRTAPDDSRAVLVDLRGHETSLWPEQAGAYADTGIPWAPDGRSLALMTGDGLIVVDVDGGNPRRLGNLAYCWVEWSPDGTAVYGPQDDHCGGQVRVIPAAHPESATTSMEGVLSWQRVAP